MAGYTYDPKSHIADEFIHDGEIQETLKYAEEHSRDRELIEMILDKARPRKTEDGWHCAGLDHREASVLLACELPDLNERIFETARE
ncbi:MAG: [FeFe] hydrogenase H-cluster radical SAM maturase HydG, partial [Abditibacteriota bacterium]|nr:[FeFe] hydrogenase H-cluster radical SAM maturase HydG [Abditibacteriota bacterium]